MCDKPISITKRWLFGTNFLRSLPMVLLKVLVIELDKTRFAVELAGIYRLKPPAPGVTVDASPHLSSLLSKRRVEMGSGFLMGVQLPHIPKKMV